MVQFCLKLLYQGSKSKNKCLGLHMAGMEMNCILKKTRLIFFLSLKLLSWKTRLNFDDGLFFLRKFTWYLHLSVI